MSTDTVSGSPAPDVAELYRSDGFQVQVVDLDVNPVVDAMVSTGHVCLAIRNGVVIQASRADGAATSSRPAARSAQSPRRAPTKIVDSGPS